MSNQPPVDATTTAAWNDLSKHADGFSPDLRGWFEADASRAGDGRSFGKSAVDGHERTPSCGGMRTRVSPHASR